MNQNKFKSNIGKLDSKKRRGVAEVISTLLLVAITVVGAVILTSFIDESFVSGALSVTSGTDTTIKTIRLLAYDTRNGDGLMDTNYSLNNRNIPAVPDVLCRDSCIVSDTTPDNGGSDFMTIQIENRSVNSIFLKEIILDGVGHTWDSDTVSIDLNTGAATSGGGAYPRDGTFSILPSNGDLTQTSKEIASGQVSNILIKLHSNDVAIPDIELSKTMRVQVNIGESSLADFLIETGDAR